MDCCLVTWRTPLLFWELLRTAAEGKVEKKRLFVVYFYRRPFVLISKLMALARFEMFLRDHAEHRPCVGTVLTTSPEDLHLRM